MVYYKKTDYKLLNYQKSNNSLKKYDAVIRNRKTGKIILVPFGAAGYENFGDKTGLGLYKSHGDKERRRLYRLRHQHFLKDGYYSPGYFSMRILWT
jgi:hypothetical protein